MDKIAEYKKVILLVLLVGLLLSFSCKNSGVMKKVHHYPEPIEQAPEISVLVKSRQSSVTIRVEGDFYILPLYGSDVIRSERLLRKGVIQPDGKNLKLNSLKISCSGIRIVGKEQTRIYLSGDRYPGELVVLNRSGKHLDVINRVDLETYLCGVLKCEVNPSWPASSLKAQAVASRTYALFQMKERADREYHLSSTTLSQVYKGSKMPSLKVSRAVRATRGIIIVYDWHIVEARFCSSCGGTTANNDNVFYEPFTPVLSGRKCPFCGGSPDINWSVTLGKADIANALRQHARRKIDRIRRIEPHRYGVGKRIAKIKIVHSRGSEIMKGNDFRLAIIKGIGVRKLKSLKCTISNQENTVTFSGSGWGHGVGMCQFGAKGMAERGYDFLSILKYYYRGCDFLKIY